MWLRTYGNLLKGSFQFGQGQIDGVVLDVFAKTIDGLQQYVDFSQIAVQLLELTKRKARFQSLVCSGSQSRTRSPIPPRPSLGQRAGQCCLRMSRALGFPHWSGNT